MSGAGFTALAGALDWQLLLLRQEAERVRAVAALLAREPATGSWQGVARTAFDRELGLLRERVDSALVALEEAVVCTSRAVGGVRGDVG